MRRDISALALKLLDSAVRLGEQRETGWVGQEDLWKDAGLVSTDYDEKYVPACRELINKRYAQTERLGFYGQSD